MIQERPEQYEAALDGHLRNTLKVRCYLCKKPCTGEHRDSLGEDVMGFDNLPVCDDCDDHLRAESFDHKEWSDA